MDVKSEKTLTVTLKGKELSDFKKVIKKCSEEDNRIGFGKKVFSEDESKLIKDINEFIKE